MKFNGGPTELLLSRLANVKKSGKGWMCSCPAHGGHDCLTVEEADGKTLVHCFAGCDVRDVVGAVDLRLSDLFADSLNPERRREYQIQSATAARAQAKLVIAAGANVVQTGGELSDFNISEMAEAQARIDAANQQLEELQYYETSDENPLLKRLSYDSDAALDLLANQQWLIDNVLPADAFGVIFGPSGTYKSFLAMDMSASIASAQKWQGIDVDNPGHVLYIAAEGASGLHMRKRAWEIRHKVGKISNLGILGSAVTINSAIECEQLVQLCEHAAEELDAPIVLIVIDTLARSFAGDENSAADMGAFVKACDRIRERTGATVLVIHHAGKEVDKGARGSSALRAACDFEFKVTSSGKKVSKLNCTKAKDSDPPDDMDFKLESVEIGKQDAKGRPMVSLVPKRCQEGEMPRGDLTGVNQTINNLIGQEMARNGQDFVMRKFLLDSFYSVMGDKSDSKRVQFNRALRELSDNGWILIDEEGKITRDDPF